MRTLKSEVLHVIKALKDEDMKLLHVIDRIGPEETLNTIKSQVTKDKILGIIKNIDQERAMQLEDDNFDIIEKLAYLENPFMKESGFKTFYHKILASDCTLSTFNEVYQKSPIDNELEVKEGYYKNIFSDLKVKVTTGDSNLAHRINLADRNRRQGEEHIVLSDISLFETGHELSKYFDDAQLMNIQRQFVLYHELAHFSGSQLFSLSKAFEPRRLIFHETHSDICSVIKTIQDNKFNKEQSIALVNDVLIARSNQNQLSTELFVKKETEFDEHLTHVGLMLLRDFIKEDLKYIHHLKNDEISKFSIIMTEQAHQPAYINQLFEELTVFPKDKKELHAILEAELLDGQSFLGKLMKFVKNKYPDSDPVVYGTAKMKSNKYIELDVSFKALLLTDKHKLITHPFPFSNILADTIKEDFEFFRKEYKENNVKLSAFFDMNELKEKTSKFKFRPAL